MPAMVGGTGADCGGAGCGGVVGRAEPSIGVSPRDQLASDSPSFGGPAGTLADFFTAPRDRLASHRRSFGRSSAALANLFIAARDWSASYRAAFGGAVEPL